MSFCIYKRISGCGSGTEYLAVTPWGDFYPCHQFVGDADFRMGSVTEGILRDDIRERFGDDVAFLVGVVTKEKKEKYVQSKQVDNYRQILASMQFDVRALLIKLADRLHNMRTLNSMRPDKQMKIAGETDYFYAPLANRLGLYHVKSELENLSFRYRCPREYALVEGMLAEERTNDRPRLERFTSKISETLKHSGIEARTEIRYRKPYSIWRKMQAKGSDIKHVDGKHYIRIIYPNSTEYSEKTMSLHIYSVLTDIFKEKPGSVANYIDAPKENGYQSFHVKLLTEQGIWEEVHISSERMVRNSRLGCAAECTEENVKAWLEKFKSILQDVASDSHGMEFMDGVTLSFYNDDIMVFTPKGRGVILPKGATALDFAFEIHTDIGRHCIGAKVNNKLVPLNYELQSGDQVEILTSKQQQPQPEWINYVTTIRGKRELAHLSKQANKLFREKGEKILNDTFKALGMKQSVGEYISPIVQKTILQHFSYQTLDDLLIGLGKEEITINQLFSLASKNGRKIVDEETFKQLVASPQMDEAQNILSAGSQHTCPCCNAIPGDEVIGFRNADGTISIHHRNCEEALRLKSQQGPKIVSVHWNDVPQSEFFAFVEIKGLDRKRMLMDIIEIISNQFDNNINELKVSTIGGIFRAVINIAVENASEINAICEKLQAIEGIEHVSRINKG